MRCYGAPKESLSVTDAEGQAVVEAEGPHEWLTKYDHGGSRWHR